MEKILYQISLNMFPQPPVTPANSTPANLSRGRSGAGRQQAKHKEQVE